MLVFEVVILKLFGHHFWVQVSFAVDNVLASDPALALGLDQEPEMAAHLGLDAHIYGVVQDLVRAVALVVVFQGTHVNIAVEIGELSHFGEKAIAALIRVGVLDVLVVSICVWRIEGIGDEDAQVGAPDLISVGLDEGRLVLAAHWSWRVVQRAVLLHRALVLCLPQGELISLPGHAVLDPEQSGHPLDAAFLVLLI